MVRVIKPIVFVWFFMMNLSVAIHSYAAPISIPLLASDEHVVWQRAPIEIVLPVGTERFVTFPVDVQFGYNTAALPPSVLRVENDNRTLYLTAKQAFDTQRVEAKLENGDIILLDLSAKENADGNPIDIVLPQLHSSSDQTDTTNSYASTASVNYVSLIRYAVQELYAPERLLTQSFNITRFPMETTHVVPIFYDGSASAMPLASWRGDNLYVTALLIKNTLNQSLRLDPRLLCGEWRSASFYPQTLLEPHGTPVNQDTSTLFVVSDQPFANAIQHCQN